MSIFGKAPIGLALMGFALSCHAGPDFSDIYDNTTTLPPDFTVPEETCVSPCCVPRSGASGTPTEGVIDEAIRFVEISLVLSGIDDPTWQHVAERIEYYFSISINDKNTPDCVIPEPPCEEQRRAAVMASMRFVGRAPTAQELFALSTTDPACDDTASYPDMLPDRGPDLDDFTQPPTDEVLIDDDGGSGAGSGPGTGGGQGPGSSNGPGFVFDEDPELDTDGCPVWPAGDPPEDESIPPEESAECPKEPDGGTGGTTADPVDLRHGTKSGVFIDAQLTLPGPDWTLRRRYNSGAADRRYYQMGAGWTFSAMKWIRVGHESEPPPASPTTFYQEIAMVHGVGDEGSWTYRRASESATEWVPNGPSNSYIEETSVTLDGKKYATWALMVPGRRRYDFYRKPGHDELDFEQVDDRILNRILSEQDEHGNKWSYKYTVLYSGGSRVGIRLSQITFSTKLQDGSSNSVDIARVRFKYWYTNETPARYVKGKLARVLVERPDPWNVGQWYEVGRTDYRYKMSPRWQDSGTFDVPYFEPSSDECGRVGDLIEVAQYSRLGGPEVGDGGVVASPMFAASDPGYPGVLSIEQYRYHGGQTDADAIARRNAYGAIDERFKANGRHELKAIIPADAVEYAADRIAAGIGSNAGLPSSSELLSSTAAYLLTLDDHHVVCRSVDDFVVRTLDLASNIVDYKELFPGVPDPLGEDGRVLTQYKSSGCGCGGGQFSKLSYEYDSALADDGTEWFATQVAEAIPETTAESEFGWKSFADEPFRRRRYLQRDTDGYGFRRTSFDLVAGGPTDFAWHVRGWEVGPFLGLVVKEYYPSAFEMFQHSALGSVPIWNLHSDSGLVRRVKYLARDKISEGWQRGANDSSYEPIVRWWYYQPGGLVSRRDDIFDPSAGADGATTTLFLYGVNSHSLSGLRYRRQLTEVAKPDEHGPDVVSAAPLLVTQAVDGVSTNFTESIVVFTSHGEIAASRDEGGLITAWSFPVVDQFGHWETQDAGLSAGEVSSLPSISGVQWGVGPGGVSRQAAQAPTTRSFDSHGREVYRSLGGGAARYMLTLAADPASFPGFMSGAATKYVSLGFLAEEEVTGTRPVHEINVWAKTSGGRLVGSAGYTRSPFVSVGPSIGLNVLDDPNWEELRDFSLHGQLRGMVRQSFAPGLVQSRSEEYFYNDRGLRYRTEFSNGDVVELGGFDLFDRPRYQSRGRVDGELLRTTEWVYDDNDGDAQRSPGLGNGWLSWVVVHPTEASARADMDQGTLTDEARVTRYRRDFRGRVIEEIADDGRVLYYEWDNLTNNVQRAETTTVVADPFAAVVPERRVHKKFNYDNAQRLYKRHTAIDPTDEATGFTAESWWRDLRGYVIATRQPTDLVQIFERDALGRSERSYQIDPGSGFDTADTTAWSRAIDPNGEAVFSVSEVIWDQYARAVGTRELRATGAPLPSVGQHESEMIEYLTATAFDALGRKIHVATAGPDSDYASPGTRSVDWGLVAAAATRQEMAGLLPGARVRSIEYDELGRVERTILPDETRVEARYDGEGRVIASGTNYLSSMDVTWDDTINAFKPVDAVGPVQSGASSVTTFGYDSDGRMTARLDTTAASTVATTRSQLTRYEHGADGPATGRVADQFADRLRRIVYPDGTSVSYQYDLLGQLSRTDRSSGVSLEREYDLAGRLVRETDPSGGPSGVSGVVAAHEFEYDDFGELLEARTLDASGAVLSRITYSREESGRLLSLRQRMVADAQIAPAGDAHDYTATYSWASMPDGQTLWGIAGAPQNFIRLEGVTLPSGTQELIRFDGLTSSSNRISRVVSQAYIDPTPVVIPIARYDYAGVTERAATILLLGSTEVSRSFDDPDGLQAGFPGISPFQQTLRERWSMRVNSSMDLLPIPLIDDRYTRNTAGDITMIDDARPTSLSDRYEDRVYLLDEQRRVTQEMNAHVLADSTLEFPQNVVESDTPILVDRVVDGFGNTELIERGFEAFAGYIPTVNSSRSHTSAQQPLAQTSGSGTGGTPEVDWTHDDSGNAVERIVGASFSEVARAADHEVRVFDAWNRLVAIRDHGAAPGAAPLLGIVYDAFGRPVRVVEDAAISPTGVRRVVERVYDERNKLVEEYRFLADSSGTFSSTPTEVWQYCWSRVDGHLAFERSTTVTPVATYEMNVAVVTDELGTPNAKVAPDGSVTFRGDFGLFGSGRGYHPADFDKDGDVDLFDSREIDLLLLAYPQNADGTAHPALVVGGASYEAWLDLNLDGVIDSDDLAALTSSGMPAQSADWRAGMIDGSSIGYTGGQSLGMGLTLLGARVLDNYAGVWLQRDAMLYVDGPNPYEYARGNPVSVRDTSGYQFEETNNFRIVEGERNGIKGTFINYYTEGFFYDLTPIGRGKYLGTKWERHPGVDGGLAIAATTDAYQNREDTTFKTSKTGLTHFDSFVDGEGYERSRHDEGIRRTGRNLMQGIADAPKIAVTIAMAATPGPEDLAIVAGAKAAGAVSRLVGEAAAGLGSKLAASKFGKTLLSGTDHLSPAAKDVLRSLDSTHLRDSDTIALGPGSISDRLPVEAYRNRETYTDLATREGLDAFAIDGKVWDTLHKEIISGDPDRRAAALHILKEANFKFLDDAIDAGKNIRLSEMPTPDLLKEHKSWAQEIEYLKERGYTEAWDAEGRLWLVLRDDCK